MKASTFRIISGVTTALATAGVAIVNLSEIPNAALVSGIIVAIAGCVDEVCTLFIKNKKDSE